YIAIPMAACPLSTTVEIFLTDFLQLFSFMKVFSSSYCLTLISKRFITTPREPTPRRLLLQTIFVHIITPMMGRVPCLRSPTRQRSPFFSIPAIQHGVPQECP